MLDVVIWVALAALLVALVVLQVVGNRALEAWGVKPSAAVITLRTVNTVAVVGIMIYIFWEWVIR
ncbi:MAG: hypothetical protein PF636_03490 [Actinomycetota bacterium]|jgi:hypothetical protein|nr:hypothetical protein [Actinomycetota bacterium]